MYFTKGIKKKYVLIFMFTDAKFGENTIDFCKNMFL